MTLPTAHAKPPQLAREFDLVVPACILGAAAEFSGQGALAHGCAGVVPGKLPYASGSIKEARATEQRLVDWMAEVLVPLASEQNALVILDGESALVMVFAPVLWP